MKRVLLSLFLAISLLVLVPNGAISRAQEVVTETDTPVGVDTNATESSIIISQRVNYELPYPGMLPDNPFYFLKVLRDGIVKLLINEEMTMARFSLENAEKRMYAGKLLLRKDKDKIAVETISKSNNYLDDALKAINEAKKQNLKDPDVRPFLQQAKSAISKHQEIMRDEKKSVGKEFMNQFVVEGKRLENYKKTVDNLLRTK